MALPAATVYGVEGSKPAASIGIFSKRGGIILSTALGINLLDQDINQTWSDSYCKFVHVGSGGNLVYITPDNQLDCFLSLKDGQIVPLVGSSILTSATIQGVTVSTTCNDITWHGGE